MVLDTIAAFLTHRFDGLIIKCRWNYCAVSRADGYWVCTIYQRPNDINVISILTDHDNNTSLRISDPDLFKIIADEVECGLLVRCDIEPLSEGYNAVENVARR